MSYPSTTYAYGFDLGNALLAASPKAAWEFVNASGLNWVPADYLPVEANPFVCYDNAQMFFDVNLGPIKYLTSQQTSPFFVFGVKVPGEEFPTSRSIVQDAANGKVVFDNASLPLQALKDLFVSLNRPLPEAQLHFICGY